MKPVAIGLVGLGRHGMRYARHLLEPLPQARLVAVCRRDPIHGAAFASEHGLRFHQDYRALVADPAVEAVVVVTPPSLTRAICLEAVRARKPILIEKPLATGGSDAREMVEAADAAGVPLMTAQTLRFDPAIVALKAELASAGPRRYLVLTSRMEHRPDLRGEATHYAGRGVLLEVGIHLLDLVRFLTGEEVAEVRCEMDPSPSDGPEDRAVVSLRTGSGLPVLVEVSRVAAGRVCRAEWIGGQAQLIADWARHRLVRITEGSKEEEQPVEGPPSVVAVLRAFTDGLLRGTPMPVTGLDGQRAVEIADACYESAAAGRTIRLAGSP
ncbi:Gfo/Idh/MocA family protein [Nitrospira sp. Kam-Ns4a]